MTDPELYQFLDDSSEPPEPEPLDDLMKQKADVIVLPTVSVTVWAIGAIIAYIGAQAVYTNTISEFETILDHALGRGADWSWAEAHNEPTVQADHLTESLKRVAYRSEDSDFYSITGNDYLRFLSMTSPLTIIDPKKLKDLMDGKVTPWGRFAREYFAALQVASVQARHLSLDESSQGLCLKATVTSIGTPKVPYSGRSRARGPINVIPAAILASLKATVRCGMYDSSIMDFINSYAKVSGMRGSTFDIFISHTLKTASLLSKYVGVCQLPPQIEVSLDAGDCIDGPI